MNSRQKLIEQFTLNSYEKGYLYPTHSLLSSMFNMRKQYVLNELQHVTSKHAILEVGCAFGGILREVIDAGYRDLSACDISMASLKKARVYVPEAFLTLCAAERLTYKAQSKDVVICVGVLNYVQDPQKVLVEMYRVLCEDGILILSFGNALGSTRAIVQFGRFRRREKVNPQGYRHWTARYGKEMLHKAGFSLDRDYYILHALSFEYRYAPQSSIGGAFAYIRKLLINLVGSWWGSEVVLIAHKVV